MKNIIFITIVSLVFASCGNPRIPKSLPVEKVYIMEFDFVPMAWNGDTDELFLDMELLGLVELKNNFDLEITKRAANGEYFEAEFSVPDSLRIGINKIIRENQTDTAYVYKFPKEENLKEFFENPHESYYRIVIERKFYESTKIFFNKSLLPDDMKILLDQLYENPMRKKDGQGYQDFVDRIQSETIKSLKKYNVFD